MYCHIIMCGDTMGNMTLSIPDEVQKDMKHFSEVKWSEVARRAIQERLEILRLAEKLAKKSKLSAKEVKEFSKEITASATKRFLDASSS
ncbi:hypothetical protein HYT58_02645 [Candidatus Woesearchaeota archaeon]|nr:hypothetical protein [Candidatus Woesearchaeota archaeon]